MSERSVRQHHPPETPESTLGALSARLRALPPSLGGVRLVAVDGHAGSGKSTLTDRLACALGGAPVVRLDDLSRHGALFGWLERLTSQVLEPLARGEQARYEVYDWERRACTRSAVAEPAPVVLLEGVGAGRRALRPRLAYLIWLDVDQQTAWAQGRRRDGVALTEFWEDWKQAECGHFADDPSKPCADILLVPRGDGYAVCER